MKKLLLIITLLTGAATYSNAQGFNQGTPAERAERSFSRLPATLNLTADQKSKVMTIYVAQVKPQDSLIAVANGDFESIRPKFLELSAATDKKIIAILTAEQKPAYETYAKERAARMGGQR
jgi:Spy/CpxP family protein refolding chaperone